MLSLAEELLLLALDDEKGTISGSAQTTLKYGLAAAGIMDLLLAGKMVMGEKNKVSVPDSAPTGDDILDEMLADVQQSRRLKSIGDWVRDFGNGKIKNLGERLETRLVEKGVVRVEEGRFLKLFPWHHYPTLDGGPEAETRERIRMVLIGGEDPDARTATLISLARACRLLDGLFPKEERKRAGQRAKEIAKGEFAGAAVARAVVDAEAATAAMIAAITAASVTSTTSSS